MMRPLLAPIFPPYQNGQAAGEQKTKEAQPHGHHSAVHGQFNMIEKTQKMQDSHHEKEDSCDQSCGVHNAFILLLGLAHYLRNEARSRPHPQIDSLPKSHIISKVYSNPCLMMNISGFKSHPEFFHFFRPRLFHCTNGIKCAPMTVAVTRTL
jgi:hypothetical protein